MDVEKYHCLSPLPGAFVICLPPRLPLAAHQVPCEVMGSVKPRGSCPPLPCCHPYKVTCPHSPAQEHLTPFSSSPVHGGIPIPSVHSSLSFCQPTCKQLLLLVRNQLCWCCVFPSSLFLPVSVALIPSGLVLQLHCIPALCGPCCSSTGGY